MRIAQRPRDLRRDVQRIFERELGFPLETIAERFPLDIRHDVVEEAVRLARIVEGEDVRVPQAGRDLDLPQEPLGAQGCGELGPQHLHRDLPPVPDVAGHVDYRHAPGADRALKLVPPGERGGETVEHVGHATQASVAATAKRPRTGAASRTGLRTPGPRCSLTPMTPNEVIR